MRKKRPSVGSLSMQNYPNKSAGTVFINPASGGGVAPTNVVAPVISGSTSLGSVLTTTNGTWSGTPATFSYTYQWKRNGSPIGGATSSTYTTVVADSLANITCEVTADNGVPPTATVGSNTLTMANYTPANTVPPSVTGTAVVGQTLSTTNGTWTNSPSTFSYQWYRGAIAISGATNSTYTLVQADAGNTSNIKCVVTATNGAGSASADSNTIAQILDADMKLWLIDNVGIQNNSTTYFTSTRQRTGAQLVSYYNDFYIGLKSNNIYSAIRAMYRPRFANSLLNRFNMVNPATYLMVYSGTWTYQETGELPNGVNASCNGGLAVNVMGQNSITIGVDLYTAGTAGNRIDVSGDSSSVYIAARYDAGPILGNSISNVNNTGLKTVTNSGVIAFWLATRTVSTERRLYKNSTLIDTFIATSTTPVSTNIIFGRGAAGVDFCDRGQRFRIVADGLTGTQITALNTLLSTLTTSEGI